MTTPLLALLGPTASGKTEASIDIAGAVDAEIVSVDSMLVYRGMDVGTAKPTDRQRSKVRHHLIDLLEPDERLSVSAYQSLAREAIRQVRGRGRTPLLVGSGGLYYRSVVDGLAFPATDAGTRTLLEAEALAVGAPALHRRLATFDPAAASRIEPANVRRTVRALEVAAITARPFSSFALAWDRYPRDTARIAGVRVATPTLHRRIERRVASTLEGLMAEADALRARGFAGFVTASQAIGYAEAVACLEGRMTRDEALAATVRRTKALARRQMAWLRRDPRIVWFEAGEDGAVGIADELRAFLERVVRAEAGATT